MASTATRRVALFSIRPNYAEAILDGRKHVEFRRTGLSPDVAHVVVYCTAPVQRVVGTFEVAGVDNETPDVLWERYSHVGGIDRDAYDRYFSGCTSAYAIRVRRPVTLGVPVPLAHVRQGLRAPQSFQYLDDEAAARVDERLLADAYQDTSTAGLVTAARSRLMTAILGHLAWATGRTRS